MSQKIDKMVIFINFVLINAFIFTICQYIDFLINEYHISFYGQDVMIEADLNQDIFLLMFKTLLQKLNN
jgi:hypothetical protein